jgi:indolepyruvate decarboxylase
MEGPGTRARLTLGAALVSALHDHGVEEVFGIPGDFALPLFDAIEKAQLLPLYTLSHEPAIGFAADAAARMRVAPSVVAVTYGAGALNTVNAVAAAFAEKSPVVVLSGAPGAAERRGGLLLHHQVKTLESQGEVFERITCDQARLDDAARAPAELTRVLASCRRRSQPVYIEVPRDMVDAPCAAVPSPAADAPPDPEALAAVSHEVLERLAGARSPVLMIGVEVRRYGLEQPVADLAASLGIPVVTSFMGRGLLSGTGTAPSGTYLGLAGARAVADLVEQSDALLLLGVIVSDTNFGVSHRRVDLRHAIHAFDGQVSLGHHTYPGIPLGALVQALRAQAKPLAVQPAAAAPLPPSGMPADDAPIAPRDVAAALNDLMARRGRFPVAADVGDCLFTAMELRNTELVAPGYYATMGFGVPAGLGAQAASGRRPLVLVGDGAFQMTGMELGHCARYGWDPIVVVMNNRGWGMLAAFRPQARYTALGDWDFAALANALGGCGRQARTRAELRAALDQAAAERGRFQLIDVQLAPGATSPALQRFAAAISSKS